jgi:transcriptional/translational regulatory protein YebC/TACO1
MIEASPVTADADPDLAAIEAGAQDLEAADDGGNHGANEGAHKGATLFFTDPVDLDAVSKALPDYGFKVESAKLGYRPKNPVALSHAEREEVDAFLDAIDADDDVQTLYVALA